MSTTTAEKPTAATTDEKRYASEKMAYVAAGYILQGDGEGVESPVFARIKDDHQKAAWFIIGCAARKEAIIDEVMPHLFANPNTACAMIRAMLEMNVKPHFKADGSLMFDTPEKIARMGTSTRKRYDRFEAIGALNKPVRN